MKNYDPKKVILTYKGVQIQGFFEGTGITVEQETDTFEDQVGIDGEVVRVRKHDDRGTVTINLQDASPSNDYLSQQLLADKLSGLGYGNVELVDLNGTTLCTASEAWVMKPANVETADASTAREWVIRCAKLDMYVGGSVL